MAEQIKEREEMMRDRLTRLIDGFVFGSQIAVNSIEWNSAKVKELADYLIANGVIVPPCKTGDTVWTIENPWTGKLLKKPIEAYFNGVKKFSHGLYVNALFDTRKINGTRDYEINRIGKIIFFTREEAEKALKEREKDE